MVNVGKTQFPHIVVLDSDRKDIAAVDPATGVERWRTRLGGAAWRASPTGADGKIYCFSVAGEVAVLDAKTGEILSRIDMYGKEVRSTIAVAGGRLLAGGERHGAVITPTLLEEVPGDEPVVADEVRSLAMRSAEAARETGALIEDTVQKIRFGDELVEGTGAAFAKVVEQTHKATHLIEEIAVASQEQAQGIEGINKALEEIDGSTQQNAVEADKLTQAMSAFRTDLTEDDEQLIESKPPQKALPVSESGEWSENSSLAQYRVNKQPSEFKEFR